MPKFRKKPVVIDAVQWDGTDKCFYSVIAPFVQNGRSDNLVGLRTTLLHDMLVIPTLEGEMRASVGDWIIRGVKGEYYPCKPDIFEATYEAVAEPEAQSV